MSYSSDPAPLLSPQKRNVRKGFVTGRPLSSCERCKKRKIKCNTVRPHCERCLKAGAECVCQTGIEDPATRVTKRRSKGRLDRLPQSSPLCAAPFDHRPQFAMAPSGPIDWVGQSYQDNSLERNIPPQSPQAFIQSSSYQLPQSSQPFPVPSNHEPPFYPTTYDSGYSVLQDPLGWTSNSQMPAAPSFSAPQMTFPLQPDTANSSTIDDSRSVTPPIPWAPVDEFPNNPDPMVLGDIRLVMNNSHDRFKMPPVTIAPDRMDPRRDQSRDRVMMPVLVTRKVDGQQEEIATVAIRARPAGDWSRIALMCM